MEIDIRKADNQELDYLVALLQFPIDQLAYNTHGGPVMVCNDLKGFGKVWKSYQPTVDQATGGQIIDDWGIATFRGCDDKDGSPVWAAERRNMQHWGDLDGNGHSKIEAQDWIDTHVSECLKGPTRLVAAMRCYIALRKCLIIDVVAWTEELRAACNK